jgi:hypothetical protein
MPPNHTDRQEGRHARHTSDEDAGDRHDWATDRVPTERFVEPVSHHGCTGSPFPEAAGLDQSCLGISTWLAGLLEPEESVGGGGDTAAGFASCVEDTLTPWSRSIAATICLSFA